MGFKKFELLRGTTLKSENESSDIFEGKGFVKMFVYFLSESRRQREGKRGAFEFTLLFWSLHFLCVSWFFLGVPLVVVALGVDSLASGIAFLYGRLL